MMTEEWRQVPGYPRYEVSSYGRVRSSNKTGRDRVNLKPWKILRPAPNPSGYPGIVLSQEGKRRTVCVHRLVAEVFIGPRPPGMDTNHIDGNKANNRLDNLEYITRSENEKHAHRLGLKKSNVGFGERHPNASLTQAQADEIRRRCLTTTERTHDIAKSFGVSASVVTRILMARQYTDSPSPPSPINSRARCVTKLSEEQKAEAREAYARGEGSCRSLAARFGVSHETIRVLVK